MVKKKFVLFLVLLSVLESLTTNVDNKNGKISFRHKHTDRVHKEKRIYFKQINLKCWPQRCNIICPLVLQQQLPGVQQILQTTIGSTMSTLSSTRPTQGTTPSESTVEPPENTANKTLIRTNTGVRSQIVNDLSGSSHPLGNYRIIYKSGKYDLYSQKILMHRERIIKNVSNYYVKHLTKIQERLILKKFILGNKSGKKSYKFRQFAPYGCYVQCEEFQQIQPNQPIPPIQQLPEQLAPGSTVPPGDTEESDEETEEPYHEGEDKPNEVTVSPPDQRKLYDFDDFNHLKNFGDPEIAIEDKRKKQRSKNKIKIK